MKKMLAIVVLSLSIVILAPIATVDAVNYPSIGIYSEEDPNPYTGPIIDTSTVLFNTDTDSNGETAYRLPPSEILTSTDRYILITPAGGNYQLSVGVSGIDRTFLGVTGLRVMLSIDEEGVVGYANLSKDNSFSSNFTGIFSAGINYHISITTIEEYNSTVVPVNVTDFSFTFTIDSIEHCIFSDRVSTLKNQDR